MLARASSLFEFVAFLGCDHDLDGFRSLQWVIFSLIVH